MVEHIKRLRNAKVHEFMLYFGDPNNMQGDGSIRLTRASFDMIPPILTVDVETFSSIVTSVNVVASRRSDAVLQLEATQRNIELLLGEPKNDVWTPTFAHEHTNVFWLASLSVLRMYWWDSKLKKRRAREMRVKISSSMADSDKHDAVMKAVAVLQAFYDLSLIHI